MYIKGILLCSFVSFICMACSCICLGRNGGLAIMWLLLSAAWTFMGVMAYNFGVR